MLLLKYDDLGGDIVCGTNFTNVAPFQALAALMGKPSGNWTFRIRDAYKMILEH
jgi:hypothetical protein